VLKLNVLHVFSLVPLLIVLVGCQGNLLVFSTARHHRFSRLHRWAELLLDHLRLLSLLLIIVRHLCNLFKRLWAIVLGILVYHLNWVITNDIFKPILCLNIHIVDLAMLIYLNSKI
jgi:hypothetical protein